MKACTWLRRCPQRNVQVVWRTTARGLLIHEYACATHLKAAIARGYKVEPPPSPPVAGLPNPCEWPPACPHWGVFRLVKVGCPDGPVADTNICFRHLVPARAEGWLPTPEGPGWLPPAN